MTGPTVTTAVTVMVTNVNEDGMVTLSSQTPVVGIALTATLTDADGGITGAEVAVGQREY